MLYFASITKQSDKVEHNQSKLYALLNTLSYTFIGQSSPVRPQLQNLSLYLSTLQQK